MAKRFHPLKVKELEKTTDDCTIVSFEVEEELKELFQYKQGQYLTLKAEIDGESIRRSYSLCSSPLDNEWKVAIKKIDGGRFSTFANDYLKVGDELEVMVPNGSFYCDVDKSCTKHYVAFAAGSGITPIASILKTHLKEEPNSKASLFYVNRSVQSIILREEIEALKNKYLGRFELYHFLTKEERDAPLFNGRFTEEKLEQIANSLIDLSQIDDVFICGPMAMTMMIKDFMIKHGVDSKKVHFELFGVPPKEKSKEQVETVNNSDLSEVSIINNGTKTSFEMPQGRDNYILDAALSNNADLPFACKGGVCCTCRAKLIEGEVDMQVNYALEEEEVEAGYILTCQAVPKSKNILVDFDS